MPPKPRAKPGAKAAAKPAKMPVGLAGPKKKPAKPAKMPVGLAGPKKPVGKQPAKPVKMPAGLAAPNNRPLVVLRDSLASIAADGGAGMFIVDNAVERVLTAALKVAPSGNACLNLMFVDQAVTDAARGLVGGGLLDTVKASLKNNISAVACNSSTGTVSKSEFVNRLQRYAARDLEGYPVATEEQGVVTFKFKTEPFVEKRVRLRVDRATPTRSALLRMHSDGTVTFLRAGREMQGVLTVKKVSPIKGQQGWVSAEFRRGAVSFGSVPVRAPAVVGQNAVVFIDPATKRVTQFVSWTRNGTGPVAGPVAGVRTMRDGNGLVQRRWRRDDARAPPPPPNVLRDPRDRPGAYRDYRKFFRDGVPGSDVEKDRRRREGQDQADIIQQYFPDGVPGLEAEDMMQQIEAIEEARKRRPGGESFAHRMRMIEEAKRRREGQADITQAGDDVGSHAEDSLKNIPNSREIGMSREATNADMYDPLADFVPERTEDFGENGIVGVNMDPVPAPAVLPAPYVPTSAAGPIGMPNPYPASAAPRRNVNITIRNTSRDENEAVAGGPQGGGLIDTLATEALADPFLDPLLPETTPEPEPTFPPQEMPLPAGAPAHHQAAAVLEPACPVDPNRGTFFCMSKTTLMIAGCMILLACALVGLGYWFYRKRLTARPGTGGGAGTGGAGDLGLGGLGSFGGGDGGFGTSSR